MLRRFTFTVLKNRALLNSSTLFYRALPTISAPNSVDGRRYISNSSRHFAAHQAFSLKTVEDRVMLVLSLYDKINPEKLHLDSDLFNDLGLDSLDHVEVIVALEDEFQCEIPDGDAENLRTPRQIFQYFCDKYDIYE